MPYCERCGAELVLDARFCPRCGTPVRFDASTGSGEVGRRGPSTWDSGQFRSGIEALAGSRVAQEYWIRRLIAYVIDTIALSVAVALVTIVLLVPLTIGAILTGGAFVSAYSFGVFPLIVGLISLLYFPVLESSRGATLGKMVMGLKVQTIDGGKPRVLQALLRNVSKVYWPLVLLDVLLGLVFQRDYRKKLSDYFVGTVVV